MLIFRPGDFVITHSLKMPHLLCILINSFKQIFTLDFNVHQNTILKLLLPHPDVFLNVNYSD